MKNQDTATSYLKPDIRAEDGSDDGSFTKVTLAQEQSTENSLSEHSDSSEDEFNFATLIPSEVWEDLMPVSRLIQTSLPHLTPTSGTKTRLRLRRLLPRWLLPRWLLPKRIPPQPTRPKRLYAHGFQRRKPRSSPRRLHPQS